MRNSNGCNNFVFKVIIANNLDVFAYLECFHKLCFLTRIFLFGKETTGIDINSWVAHKHQKFT